VKIHLLTASRLQALYPGPTRPCGAPSCQWKEHFDVSQSSPEHVWPFSCVPTTGQIPTTGCSFVALGQKNMPLKQNAALNTGFKMVYHGPHETCKRIGKISSAGILAQLFRKFLAILSIWAGFSWFFQILKLFLCFWGVTNIKSVLKSFDQLRNTRKWSNSSGLNFTGQNLVKINFWFDRQIQHEILAY